MKKIIVTTTINAPTEAIRAFDALPDWRLIVIGDRKTPSDYRLARGDYVSPEVQEDLFPELSAAIGWNCIQRRNLGFIMAHRAGADIVATVDDDNIPLPGWGENLLLGHPTPCYQWHAPAAAFEPIRAAGDLDLWHRGFPLPLLAHRHGQAYCGKGDVTADIQADFWNGDPDVDAICRLQYAPQRDFNRCNFPFAGDKPSPFNSQNTFLTRRVLPHYFMMCGVGRMDDIWAGYHVQAQGFRVIYGAPSVVQRRNDHDLIRDMKGEYLGYEQNHNIVKELPTDKKCVLDRLSVAARRAFEIYQNYFNHG